MEKFTNVNELVNSLKPVNPDTVYAQIPLKIPSVFKNNFPGKILYAVKTNPNEYVLKHIIKNSIDRFDVASINVTAIRNQAQIKVAFYTTYWAEKIFQSIL